MAKNITLVLFQSGCRSRIEGGTLVKDGNVGERKAGSEEIRPFQKNNYPRA